MGGGDPEIEKLTLLGKFFLLLAALLLIQSTASLVDGYRFLRFVRAGRRRPLGEFTPHAAVIIPIKGIDPDFERNLRHYLEQDYARFELILVVASEKDPAYSVLAQALAGRAELVGEGSSPKTTLVIAGRTDLRGEKVHGLLRGVEVVRPETEVLVFADADARPERDWLRSLVAPLEDSSVTVSTGFRWYLPGSSFVSQLRAAWDTSIATLLGDHKDNFAWGGSMAIGVRDFKRLKVAEDYWAHTASDDYALTRAVREHGGKITFQPRCLVASCEDSSFAEFLAWANRQIIITRVYRAKLWRLGLAAHLLYGVTMLVGLSGILLTGASGPARWGMAAPLLVILSLGLAKARLRTVLAGEIFPEERSTLERYGARYWQLQPLVPWIMLFNFMVAGCTRRIEWRGVHYELVSRDELRVLKRDNP